MTARSYCFTLNNPEDLLDFTDDEFVRYAIYQEEVGENGNYHFQGYIEMSRPTRIAELQRLIPGAHFEIRRGTRDEARDYCKKRDSTYIDGPYEYGVWRSGGQGTRNDWNSVKEKIKNGASDKEIFDSHPDIFVKYHRGISVAQKLFNKRRDWKTLVTVYHGSPGTGKTRAVHENCPDAYWKQNDSKWWDGYDGHEIVVLDDFYGWIPYSTMLRLLDRYPMMVETKGGNVEFLAKEIYITSNRPPTEWYKNLKDTTALTRRIETIVNFDSI